jgi:iron complex transport system substrate-binding protein
MISELFLFSHASTKGAGKTFPPGRGIKSPFHPIVSLRTKVPFIPPILAIPCRRLNSYKFFIVSAILSLSFTVNACSRSGSTSDNSTQTRETRRIATYMGEIDVPAHPQRVAFIQFFLDHATAMGQAAVGALSVRRDFGTDLPPYLADKVSQEGTVFFNFTNDPDPEAIFAANPDLIVGWRREGAEKVFDQLTKIAPTVLMDHEWGNLEESMAELGHILNREAEARAAMEEYNAAMARYAEKIQGVIGEENEIMFLRIRPKDYRVYGPYGQSKRVLLDNLKFTPLRNYPPNEDYVDVSMEGIFTYSPDHILINIDAGEDADKLYQALSMSEVWKSLDAVKRGHVYIVDDFLSSTLGPNGSIYAVERLVAQILEANS